MENEEFLKLMKRYVANVAISGSTLRNQGAKGVADTARAFLGGELDLTVFREEEPDEYPNLLDKWTEQLRARLPEGAQNWGTARKAMNVFLVQVFMNRYLAEEYGLWTFGDVLETPLDKQATRELRRIAGRSKLPRWNGIVNLQQEDSHRYQQFASELAERHGVPRACLDIMLWRTNKARSSTPTAAGQ